MVSRFAFFVVVAIQLGGNVCAQSYVGAEGALRSIEVPAAKTSRRPVIRDRYAEYWKLIAECQRAIPSLSPAEAAKKWLALLDLLPPQAPILGEPYGPFPNPAFTDAMSALPSPAAWAQMETILHGRANGNGSSKDRLLLAMIEDLRGERDQAAKELASITGLSAPLDALRAQVLVDLALVDGRPNEVEDSYRQLVVALNAQPRPPGIEHSIELPDLDLILGKARARDLLTYAMQSFDGEIVVKRGDAFAKTARDLALSMVPNLKHPQWSLAAGLDGGALFEALHRRFPNSTSGVYRLIEGDTYFNAACPYVAYLVAHDRTADATAFLKDFGFGRRFNAGDFLREVPLLRQRGKIGAFVQFLERQTLEVEPNGMLNVYYSLCHTIGEGKRADALIAKLPAAKRAWFSYEFDHELDTLTSAGKLEEAGRLLIKRLDAPDGVRRYPNGTSELVEIGRALHRPDWVELGIKAAEQAFRNSEFGFPDDWICLDLAQHGRAAEAEHLLADVLQVRTHGLGQSTPSSGSGELKVLVRVYAGAGRWGDLLTILEEAPNLGESDIAFLESNPGADDSLQFLTAQALAAAGRRPEALHVLHYVLQVDSDNDAAYALLLKLDPAGASARLDAMHRAAPMAPRPLMWKAEWLRQHSRLDEASKMVRQAIALDPEDTASTNRRQRSKAWDLLADIEQKQGKYAEARAARRRFAERTNVLETSSGSTPMDVGGPARRAKGLVTFPDDYSLVFAVADDLESVGRTEEAGALRDRACRLVARDLGPASAPNWLGYQDVPLAFYERVLVDEAAKHPDRASTFAALGIYYDGVHESPKAEDNYVKAVKRDPNFLIAWNGLLGLQESLSLPRELEEATVANVLRLAPRYLAHAKWEARDLAAVWSAAFDALGGLPPVAEPIFRLPESAIDNSADPLNHEGARYGSQASTAGAIVAADRTIADFAELIGSIASAPAGGSSK